MIAILPGVEMKLVIDYLAHGVDALRRILNEPYTERFDLYLQWVSDQQRTLGRAITARDMNRLITTRTYWVLLGSPRDSATGPIASEIESRITEIEKELADLRWESVERTRQGWKTIAVLDTNVLLELHEELQTIPWHVTIGERARRAVHVVTPIIVIDELDRLKRSQGDMILRGRKVARRTIVNQRFD